MGVGGSCECQVVIVLWVYALCGWHSVVVEYVVGSDRNATKGNG